MSIGLLDNWATTARTTLTLAARVLPWRPADWGKLPTSMDQLIYMRSNIAEKDPDDPTKAPVGFFFDAVLKEEHTTQRVITSHPIQSGGNVSDHSYKLPTQLTLEIGMSDAMSTLIPGQFGSMVGAVISAAQQIGNLLNNGVQTKSVSAYRKLVDLQNKGTMVSVQTRLQRYPNMVIEEISVSDTYKTSSSLRCTVVLKEILLGETTTTVLATLKSVAGGASSMQNKIPEAPTPQTSTLFDIHRAATQ